MVNDVFCRHGVMLRGDSISDGVVGISPGSDHPGDGLDLLGDAPGEVARVRDRQQGRPRLGGAELGELPEGVVALAGHYGSQRGAGEEAVGSAAARS